MTNSKMRALPGHTYQTPNALTGLKAQNQLIYAAVGKKRLKIFVMQFYTIYFRDVFILLTLAMYLISFKKGKGGRQGGSGGFACSNYLQPAHRVFFHEKNFPLSPRILHSSYCSLSSCKEL